MNAISPSLWFNGTAAEAARFYTGIFPDSHINATTTYPTDGLPDFQKNMAGQVLTVDYVVAGQPFVAINAGPEFSPTPAISFMVNWDPSVYPDARERLDVLWAELCDGGTILMPLDSYPFSEHYGWVQDRYGVSWQLILTNPSGEPRPMIIPSLMFGGPVVNRAREAVEYYLSIFNEAHWGTIAPYAAQTGPALPGALMFSDFTLQGTWFTAMDAGGEQDFSFTEGVSLVVECDTQEQIDHLWDALSRVPEAEACGWCKDQFGVSWQIVPRTINELMKRPGAYDALMGMKKLIIADF
ncbi:MAG: VOC family protein [Mycetocola sp.]